MQKHEVYVGMPVIFGRLSATAEKTRGTILACNTKRARIQSAAPRGRKKVSPAGVVFQVPYAYIEPASTLNPYQVWVAAPVPRKKRKLKAMPLMETVRVANETRLVTFCELRGSAAKLKEGVTLGVQAVRTMYDRHAGDTYTQAVTAMDEQILPAISHALDTLFLLRDVEGTVSISNGVLTLENGTTLDLTLPPRLSAATAVTA